jgi:hypothetical protein
LISRIAGLKIQAGVPIGRSPRSKTSDGVSKNGVLAGGASCGSRAAD